MPCQPRKLREERAVDRESAYDRVEQQHRARRVVVQVNDQRADQRINKLADHEERDQEPRLEHSAAKA